MKTRGFYVALFVLTLTLLADIGIAAPNAPQSLDAVVDGNTVTLTWSPASTGEVPTGYVIRASFSPAGPVIATLASANTTQIISNVPDGVYYVTVVAVNAQGTSGSSNEVIVSVPGARGGCTIAPNAPANLAATVAGSLVTLSWSAPVTGCPVTAYVVQAGSATGLSNLAIFNVGNTTTLSVSAPPGTYYVRVVALNSFGGSVASSEIIVNVGS